MQLLDKERTALQIVFKDLAVRYAHPWSVPEVPCVYWLMDSRRQVIYVAQTKNLCYALQCHIDDTPHWSWYGYIYQMDRSRRMRIEDTLIDLLQPKTFSGMCGYCGGDVVVTSRPKVWCSDECYHNLVKKGYPNVVE